MRIIHRLGVILFTVIVALVASKSVAAPFRLAIDMGGYALPDDSLAGEGVFNAARKGIGWLVRLGCVLP